MKQWTPNDAEAHRILSCLAVASRFRLVQTIGPGSLCVGELAISVGLSQSCTTRHLQALERAGLVRRRREGRRVFYSLRVSGTAVGEVLSWALGRPLDSMAAQGADAGIPERGNAKRKSKPSGRLERERSEAEADGRASGPDAPKPAEPGRYQELEDYLL